MGIWWDGKAGPRPAGILKVGSGARDASGDGKSPGRLALGFPVTRGNTVSLNNCTGENRNGSHSM